MKDEETIISEKKERKKERTKQNEETVCSEIKRKK